MPDRDVDLAWLIGLLHDVGRFEQLKRYGTFIDSQSIDQPQNNPAAFRKHQLVGKGNMAQCILLSGYLKEWGKSRDIVTDISCFSDARSPLPSFSGFAEPLFPAQSSP